MSTYPFKDHLCAYHSTTGDKYKDEYNLYFLSFRCLGSKQPYVYNRPAKWEPNMELVDFQVFHLKDYWCSHMPYIRPILRTWLLVANDSACLQKKKKSYLDFQWFYHILYASLVFHRNENKVYFPLILSFLALYSTSL